MPAITRSSLYGRKTKNDSSLSDQLNLNDNDDDMNTDSDVEVDTAEAPQNFEVDDMDDISPSPQPSAQEYLRPLQETVDRMSQQVERFAEALDRYKSERELTSQEAWGASFDLLQNFADITESGTAPLGEVSKSRPLQKNRKSLGDDAKQTRNLHLEAALWRLTGNLLTVQSPDNIAHAQFNQNSKLAELHRYSTNEEVWNAYLECDIVGQEHEEVVKWLVEQARSDTTEVDDVIQDAYSRSARGDVVWTTGLTYTQDAIKKRKRSETDSLPLDPARPGLRSKHIRLSDRKPLVAQIDPDASSRERACLANEDEAYDEAAWQAMWEMLRRGWSLPRIQEWWKDRNELWRAALIRDASAHLPKSDTVSWTDTTNLASSDEYLKRCQQLAQQEVDENIFERSVYSLIAGSYSASSPVCKTINDHLFCLTNELHTARYAEFLQSYRAKLQNPDKITHHPSSSSMDPIENYVRHAHSDPSTKTEASDPHTYLECIIISRKLSELLLRTGKAASNMAWLTGEPDPSFEEGVRQVDEREQRLIQEDDTIRMLAHLQLALRPLGLLDDVYERDESAMDNNVINYIEVLARQSKFELLPLYAGQLSGERASHVLGRILGRITDTKERSTQMRLMKKYNIPTHTVIYNVCEYARNTWLEKVTKTDSNPEPIKITEKSNRIIRIRTGFIGEEIEEDDDNLIIAHEWVEHIDVQHWGMAVWLITTLYKTLLLRGKPQALKALSDQISLTRTSLKVTGMNMSLASAAPDDIEEVDVDIDEDGDEPSGLTSPSKRRRNQSSGNNHPLVKEARNRAELARQSIVWAHLEQLVRAMDAIELWQILADQINEVHRDNPKELKQVKKTLRKALQALHDEIQPLLYAEFLTEANDEDEKEVLHTIRTHYLPECVLAYNSALYFAGHCLSRGHLVQCMELAQTVAQNDTITQAFVDSKRMQELVTVFAQDSQALIRANEVGGYGRGTRQSSTTAEGRDHSNIWHVEWTKDDADA